MLEVLEGMTPASAGFVLLGRPAPAQVVATAVDLALRGELRVRRWRGSWILLPGAPSRSPRRPTATGEPSAYERALLAWMLPHDRPFPLADLDEDRVAALAPVVERLVGELRRDRLVRRRLCWRTPSFGSRQPLTARGEELSGRLARLRARLRVVHLEPEPMRWLFGYLVAFGLCTGARMRNAPPALVRLAAFVADWHAVCADLPGWRSPPPDKPEYEVPSSGSLFTPGVPSGLGELGA